jgi:predicted RNase H-like HicB family nuclease
MREQEIYYTYWQEPDGFYLGYLNVWPEHWTQGKSLPELEEMLLDLYEIYCEEEQEKPIKKKTGHLKIAAV